MWRQGHNVRDAKEWSLYAKLQGHTLNVAHVAWSPDSKLLASASYDGTIIVWNLQLKRAVRTLHAAADPAETNPQVKGVVWDPVGRFLAAQSDDNTLTVWETRNWEVLARVKAPFQSAPQDAFSTRCDWSPDGLVLVVRTLCLLLVCLPLLTLFSLSLSLLRE